MTVLFCDLVGFTASSDEARPRRRPRGLYAEAALCWERFGSIPEHGYALLGRGRCLLALGDGETTPVLREAREIFAHLGAGMLLTETDALLEQALARTS